MSWGPAYTEDRITLTVEDLLLGIEFSLENCFMSLPDGLALQMHGIPMAFGGELPPPYGL